MLYALPAASHAPFSSRPLVQTAASLAALVKGALFATYVSAHAGLMSEQLTLLTLRTQVFKARMVGLLADLTAHL